MREIIAISLMVLCAGCAGTKKTITAQKPVVAVIPGYLIGNWLPIEQEMGGNKMPKAFMEKQKLTIMDSTYIMSAESIDEGIIRYNGNKMDIYGKDGVNKGKHFTAIYKYENEQLTICYNLIGDKYPENFETKGKQLYFLSVFRKEAVK